MAKQQNGKQNYQDALQKSEVHLKAKLDLKMILATFSVVFLFFSDI